MAKAQKTTTSSTKLVKPKIRRKGIHAKSKASRSSTSKNYLKRYAGQGRG